MLIYEHAGAERMPLAALADSFRGWFESEPWLERFRCPRCNVFCDFGSEGRYSELGDGICQTCNTALLPYWTDERVWEYYFDIVRRPGFNQIVGVDEQDQVQSWAWGYNLSDKPEFAGMPAGGFYGDHVGVAPAYRGDDSFAIMKEGWSILSGLGFRYMVIRTHQGAGYVRDFLATLDYRDLDHASNEADRFYMVFDPDGVVAEN